MATIQVNNLISRAATIAQDATFVRWSQTEWLDWLNDAQREVVLLKVQASAKSEPFHLLPGSTKQALPESCVQLLDVVRNLGTDGSTPGAAIRITTREVLDAQVPTWHSDANAGGTIKHYCYDPRSPKVFYVYPKAPASDWYIELVYSANPTDCVLSGAIQIDDIYANALLYLMLHRAYSKDAEYAQNGQLAVTYYQAAMQSLGVKTQHEAASNPNNTLGTGKE